MIADREAVGAKVVLLGNSGAGKTSILDYAITQTPSANLPPTIGANCSSFTVDTPGGPVQLRVWDTAGQELYRSLVPIYVRDAVAALLVYDVTDLKSIDSLDHWHSVLMEEQSAEVLIYVVANKMDLIDLALVPEAQGRAIAQKVNGSFHPVSAKTGQGIRELFNTVAHEASSGERFQTHTVKLNPGQSMGGCC
jgi:small GTP-binding protein